MKSGSLSSEDKKAAELKDKIRPGSIIYIFCDFIRNPKNKYIVILSVDFENNDSLVFIVNSDIRPLILRDPHLKQGQIDLIKDPNYNFLKHDSHLDCTEVFYDLDLDFVIQHLTQNPGDYKGELRKEEIDKIIAFVGTAQTIPPIDQEKIIKSLNA